MRNHLKHISCYFVILLLAFCPALKAQQQTSWLAGKITDNNDKGLAGATVQIFGTTSGAISNESGEFYFSHVNPGKIRVQASFVGFETRIVDFDARPGENTLDIVLEQRAVELAQVSVTGRRSEQQLIDVPVTMNVITSGFIKENNITEPERLADFIPGLRIRMQGSDRPSFVIRGLSSDEVSPAAQPRISVFYNNVPISRSGGAAVEIFDMQQIDVMKGPQETLFGRGGTIGAVHYISQKPASIFGGYLAAGFGNYNSKEINGAINLPVSGKLMVRAAGVYRERDGYITNTIGGALNGRNTVAGRFSATYLPAKKDKADLVLNYQNDDNPGIGFMSMQYTNTEGSSDPFKYTASLEQGNKLKNQRDIFDATFSYKHYFNAGNFISSISSYRSFSTDDHWDGDGTAAMALDMSENDKAIQYYQEIRLNYSLQNRLTGSAGVSYWTEKASQNYLISMNEQHLAHLFLNTGFLTGPDGNPVSIPQLPDLPLLGPLAGMPLMADHREENKSQALNKALESFADADYRITGQISITAGVRFINEWFNLAGSAAMAGGNPATLGLLTGNFPNILFRATDEKTIKESSSILTYRGGLKYSPAESTSIYTVYSKGHRPEVLQFTSTGEKQVLDAEIVNSFDAGIKTIVSQKGWLDFGIFYHNYLNFQTTAWVADPSTGEFNYITKDGGKASAYGAELNIRYLLLSNLQIFGNYAYIHSRFANKDADGSEQAYAGNMFRLTPDHSLSAGLNARFNIIKKIAVFATPSFSYNTKIYFEDANTAGLEQNAFGQVFFRGGFELPDAGVTLSFWGQNLLDKNYIISAGNAGSLFGAPTQIPGAPRMFGARAEWRF